MTETINHRRWYSLLYTEHAGAGLPPVIQADQIIRYHDETGVWLAAIWHPTTAGTPSNCILRLPGDHVDTICEHPTLAEAASRALPHG